MVNEDGEGPNLVRLGQVTGDYYFESLARHREDAIAGIDREAKCSKSINTVMNEIPCSLPQPEEQMPRKSPFHHRTLDP